MIELGLNNSKHPVPQLTIDPERLTPIRAQAEAPFLHPHSKAKLALNLTPQPLNPVKPQAQAQTIVSRTVTPKAPEHRQRQIRNPVYGPDLSILYIYMDSVPIIFL